MSDGDVSGSVEDVATDEEKLNGKMDSAGNGRVVSGARLSGQCNVKEIKSVKVKPATDQYKYDDLKGTVGKPKILDSRDSCSKVSKPNTRQGKTMSTLLDESRFKYQCGHKAVNLEVCALISERLQETDQKLGEAEYINMLWFVFKINPHLTRFKVMRATGIWVPIKYFFGIPQDYGGRKDRLVTLLNFVMRSLEQEKRSLDEHP